MNRPGYLPDFEAPPLREVAMGIQFKSIPGFTSLDFQCVRDTFVARYPHVQEHPRLSPQFEVFGGIGQPSEFGFQLNPGVTTNRLWFISEDDSHLLQFQDDRFFINWRKTPEGREYQRFETIFDNFTSEVGLLKQCLKSYFRYELEVTQAEISYINIIEVDSFVDMPRWFEIIDGPFPNVEGFAFNFSEQIDDPTGQARARLHHNFNAAFANNGEDKAVQMGFTFRGKPLENTIESGLELITSGRDQIVMRFDEITSDVAHLSWKKQYD